MSKYNMYQKELPPNPRKLPPHPIWRGIGCILIIVVPALSYLIANILIKNRGSIDWLFIPEDIVVVRFSDPFILVKIFYAAIITLVFLALITLVTFLVNSLFGLKKFGPVDVPPEEAKRTLRKSKK